MPQAVNHERIPPSREANKAEAAEFFGVHVATVDAWLRRGCPYLQRGNRGKSWVFDLLDVAKWRFGGTEEDPEEDPEKMSPKDRLDWYRGNRERDAHAKDKELLIPFDLEERIIAAAFAEIRAGLLSQHNTIASEHPEISPDAINAILAANKDFLTRLAETRLPASIEGALDALDVSADAATEQNR